MLQGVRKSYLGVWKVLRRYWRAYGGLPALFVSVYLHVAIILTLGMMPYWLAKPWWDTALSVLPNVLGFTLAGFTIWLGFGDDRFRKRLSAPSKGNGQTSAFMGVSAAFVHFVVIQICALLGAVWAQAMEFSLPYGHWLVPFKVWLAPLGHALGFLLFVYALTAALAATLGVFRAASWYDEHRRQDDVGGKVPFKISPRALGRCGWRQGVSLRPNAAKLQQSNRRGHLGDRESSL